MKIYKQKDNFKSGTFKFEQIKSAMVFILYVFNVSKSASKY